MQNQSCSCKVNGKCADDSECSSTFVTVGIVIVCLVVGFIILGIIGKRVQDKRRAKTMRKRREVDDEEQHPRGNKVDDISREMNTTTQHLTLNHDTSLNYESSHSNYVNH